MAASCTGASCPHVSAVTWLLLFQALLACLLYISRSILFETVICSHPQEKFGSGTFWKTRATGTESEAITKSRSAAITSSAYVVFHAMGFLPRTCVHYIVLNVKQLP